METIEQMEAERIERMIRVLSIDRPNKYSATSKENDLIIIKELKEKLSEIKAKILTGL